MLRLDPLRAGISDAKGDRQSHQGIGTAKAAVVLSDVVRVLPTAATVLWAYSVSARLTHV